MLSNAWIVPVARREGDAQLFCLPYAGGASATYRNWSRIEARDLDIFAVELPGRGRRSAEPAVADMGQIVDGLFEALRPALRSRVLLFGHSMGGLLAYELAHACRDRLGCEPRHLIISATRPPSISPRDQTGAYDDATILLRLERFGGTPPEILQNQALMGVLLPMLRADLILSDFQPRRDRPKLTCPVTVLAGRDDEHYPPADLLRWWDVTTGPFQLHVVSGGHFFLRDQEADVHEIIRAIVSAPPHRDREASGVPAPTWPRSRSADLDRSVPGDPR